MHSSESRCDSDGGDDNDGSMWLLPFQMWHTSGCGMALSCAMPNPTLHSSATHLLAASATPCDALFDARRIQIHMRGSTSILRLCMRLQFLL